MLDIVASLKLAAYLIAGGDPGLWSIVALSLEVSLASALFACALGLPLGGLVAVCTFPGRRAVIVILNALLGLPSVVVGLVVYLLLSRAGPLGSLGILFTPKAIVIADHPCCRSWPRSRASSSRTPAGISTAHVARVARVRAQPTLVDLRFSPLTVVLAGFGRAASEVGAVMIVGGNIDGVTRVMTTAIALETSKGDLPLALALGTILIIVVLALNAGAYAIREWSVKRHG